MTTAIETIRIGEDEIQGIVTEDGERWVALRRACEVLGVDVEGQRQKIGKLDWACTLTVKAHDASGREQELFCLHKDSVPMWLATLVPSLLAEKVREKVSRWQRLAAKALADWAYGRKPAPSAALDLRDLATVQRLALQLTGVVEEQAKALAEAAPKVDFYDRFGESGGLTGLRAAAKVLHQPEQKWVDSLKDKFLFYEGHDLVPYARFGPAGVHYFEVRAHTVNDVVRRQTFVTAKGLEYLGAHLPASYPRVRRAPIQRLPAHGA